jgi:Ca2+-binding EF-hand superfamily protein
MSADPSASSTSKRTSVAKSAAKHNAYTVAASHKTEKAKLATSPSAYSQFSKAAIKLQMMALAMQLELLEELETMSDEEKLQSLFDLLDKDRSGNLSAVELADGLRKIRGDVSFEESIALAMDRVARFDTDGDGKFQLSEFKTYVDTLCEALGASFHELSEMLIISVVFGDVDGNDDVENAISALFEEDITAAIQDEEKLSKVMKDERMVALFHLFDLDMNGSVSFQEVAMGMYKITHDLDSSATAGVGALLMFDDDGNQTLDYKEFTKFILQLIGATGMAYEDAIFSMTEAAASEDTDITPEQLNEILSKMIVEVTVEEE